MYYIAKILLITILVSFAVPVYASFSLYGNPSSYTESSVYKKTPGNYYALVSVSTVPIYFLETPIVGDLLDTGGIAATLGYRYDTKVAFESSFQVNSFRYDSSYAKQNTNFNLKMHLLYHPIEEIPLFDMLPYIGAGVMYNMSSLSENNTLYFANGFGGSIKGGGRIAKSMFLIDFGVEYTLMTLAEQSLGRLTMANVSTYFGVGVRF